MTKPRLPIIAAALLLLSAALGWFFKSAGSKPGVTGGVPAAAVSLSVQIKNASVRKTGGHAQLSLTAVFSQNGQAPLRLEPPLVSLRTANHTPAPRYLGPMLPDPVLTGPGPTELTLYYWLPVSDLPGGLILEAGGQQYPLPALVALEKSTPQR